MITKILLSALIAAGLALPGVAQAHVTRAELRHDVVRVHHQRHELREERREHDWREARQEHRQLHRAKKELHRDSRAYWRQHHHRR